MKPVDPGSLAPQYWASPAYSIQSIRTPHRELSTHPRQAIFRAAQLAGIAEAT